MLERLVGIFQAHDVTKAFQAEGLACAEAQKSDIS